MLKKFIYSNTGICILFFILIFIDILEEYGLRFLQITDDGYGETLLDNGLTIATVLLFLFIIFKNRYVERKLEESNEQYRSLFDYHPDIVFSLNHEGKITSVNQAGSNFAGVEKEKLIGQSFVPFVTESDIGKALNYFDKSLKGTPQYYEINAIGQNETEVVLSLTTIPMVVQNKTVGVYSIAKNITEQKAIEQKINYMAYHDALTGLLNRHFFHQKLYEAIQESKYTQQSLSVLFLDLDRFKLINDTAGHRFGDLLLQEVAKRLTSCVRTEDVVSRQGGDEFIFILKNVNHAEIIDICEKIIKEISQPYVIEDKQFFTSPSIGISVYPGDGEDRETLLRNADAAMYLAKQKGKNNYKFFSEDLNKKNVYKSRIEQELRTALHQNQFTLNYQPQVNIATGETVGMEALIRWYHPDEGYISPLDFIPVAEETGLIIPIGQWVLYTACKQNKLWQKAGFPPLTISVNVSVRQFQQKDFIQGVRRVLEETRLEPKYLNLEITESIMQDIDELQGVLTELKKIGVGLSIDDFGTGYSALNCIKQFPVDVIKIDRSFIKDIVTNNYDQTIVEAVIMVSHSTGMQVLAEGVETKEQFEILKMKGCDKVQGYLFSKPLTNKEFETNMNKLCYFT